MTNTFFLDFDPGSFGWKRPLAPVGSAWSNAILTSSASIQPQLNPSRRTVINGGLSWIWLAQRTTRRTRDTMMNSRFTWSRFRCETFYKRMQWISQDRLLEGIRTLGTCCSWSKGKIIKNFAINFSLKRREGRKNTLLTAFTETRRHLR